MKASGSAAADHQSQVTEEAEEEPRRARRSNVACRHRSVDAQGLGLPPGRNANVATMTANSCRQASIPAIPTAARPAERLRTPWTAHRTNGAASCSSRKSFQTSGQNSGVSGTSNAAETASASDRDSERTSV